MRGPDRKDYRLMVRIFKNIELWIKWNRLGMSLRSRGLLGTASHFFERILEVRFDVLHGVETTTKIPAHALGLDRQGHANEYTPVPTRALSRVLARLPIAYPEWDFVDLGAGKGRALLIASRFAFRKIIGVELSAELVRIARRNIETFREPQQKCFDLSVLHEDAQRYRLSSARVVLYLFDPFNDSDALKELLNNLQESLNSCRRDLYLIYWHPRSKDMFKQCPALRLIRATPEYHVYRGANNENGRGQRAKNLLPSRWHLIRYIGWLDAI